MALIVTPNANADALISRAYFETWAASMGYDISAYDGDTQIDPAIRRGSFYINTSGPYKGYKTGGREQTQAFPRTDLTDGDGEEIPDDEVPREVEQAAALASYQELLSPGSLNPTVAGGRKVKRTKVGPLEKEYFADDPGSAAAVVTAVGPLLAGYLEEGTYSNPLAGEAYRV